MQAGESLEACLNRIKQDGYMPIRRVEEPIFQEIRTGGEVTYEPVDRKITFQAAPIKTEQ